MFQKGISTIESNGQRVTKFDLKRQKIADERMVHKSIRLSSDYLQTLSNNSDYQDIRQFSNKF